MLFVCDKCDSIENTALGHCHSRNRNLFGEEYVGQALCSACAPTHYKDGTKAKKFDGVWHNVFPREKATIETIMARVDEYKTFGRFADEVDRLLQAKQ